MTLLPPRPPDRRAVRPTPRRVAAVAALLLAAAPLAAQSEHSLMDGHDHRLCGTAEPTTAEVMSSVQAAELWLSANQSRFEAVRAGAVVNIPVAMHIITSGTTVAQGNIPDAWVEAQIDSMNTAFAPMGYQFFLAFQQRVNNPTWFSGMTNGSATEAQMKNALALNPARYLNFYTVRAGNNLLGWATFPASGQETNRQQGVVVLDQSLPGGTSAPYNFGATGTHEVGHYVGLFHTFQGGCGPPGDGVDDTPGAAAPNFGCPTGTDSCPADGLGVDQIENYMDYTDDACMNRFTPGQGARSLGLMSSFRPTIMTQTGAFASATSLDFGSLFIGATATRGVSVVHVDAATITVTSIASSNPAFVPSVASGTLAGPSALQVDVAFTPTTSGAQSGTLTITTDSPTTPTFTVALSGTAALAPAAGLLQPAIAARAAVGATAQSVLTLTNSGQGALTYAIDGGAREADRTMPAAPDAGLEPQALAKGQDGAQRGTPVLFGAGGPDAFGYSWIDSAEPGGPTFAWTSIATTGTALTLGDDAASTALPLGFTFSFYGTDYTTVFVGSNGLLTFGTASTAFSNVAIPTAAAPNAFVAPYWDDLNPAAGGTVHYQQVGGTFVVQWTNVPRYTAPGAPTTGAVTMQAILSPSGEIRFQYLSIPTTNNSATIGIENQAGTVGLQVAFDTPYAAANRAVLFSRRPPFLTGITPASGTIAGGGQQDVTFAFTGVGQNVGVNQRLVTVTTNDPALAELRLHLVFAVGDTLAPPALAAPRYNAQDQPRNVALEWLPAQDAAQYEVQVAFTQAFPAASTQSQTVALPTASFNLLASRIYFWRVRSRDAAGVASEWSLPFTFRTGLMVSEDDGPARVAQTTLGLPYPNPARGTATVPVSFADAQANVSVRVLDVTGREVLAVAEGAAFGAGAHRLELDTRALPAGVYVVQLRASDRTETARLVVVR